MSRFAKWVVKNADGVIALVLGGVIALVAGFDANIINSNQVNGGILLTLAVLAATLLRDRVRAGVVERDVTQVMHQLAALDDKVAGTQHALDAASNLRVLRGSAIGKALADARRDTQNWSFKGGTGTFMRAVTLPECIDRARADGRALTMHLEILDPTDEDVCEHYAGFQRSVSTTVDGTGEVWTAGRTAKESFATILAACWYRQRYRLLTIEVGLSPTITTFRWDLSSNCLIMTQLITQADPREPALLIERGSTYYDRYATELLTSLEQARRLPIEQAAKSVPLSDEPSVEETQKLFVALNLPLPAAYDDTAVSEIIRKAVRPKNPYGRS